MIDYTKLSVVRTVTFLFFLLLVLIYYYKNILTVKDGVSKNNQLVKKLIYITIALGLINTFSITTDGEFKIVILTLIIYFFTVYNIHFSLRKCDNIPIQYKITIYIRTFIIIVFAALFMNYINGTQVFSFLYGQEVNSDISGAVSFDDVGNIFKNRDQIPSYCPDMSDGSYKETSDGNKNNKIWNKLSNEEKNNCIASLSSNKDSGRRKEIYDDVYA